MTEVLLIVNNEELDLGADNIPITKQAQSFGNLDEKLGSFSRSFTVPVTEKNRRLLESSYTFSSTTEFPYRKTEAVLIVDGIEIGVGTVIIEDNGVSSESIRLTFYCDASPFYQIASILTLWDCPLGYFDHLRTLQNIFNGKDPMSASGLNVMYPIIDYGEDTTFFTSTGGNTSSLRADRLFPAVHVKDVLQKITDKTGYRFLGEYLQPLVYVDSIASSFIYDRLILPFSKSKLERDTNLKARYTYTVQNSNTLLCDFNGQNIVFTTSTDANGFPIGQRDDQGFIPAFPTTHPNVAIRKYNYTSDRVVLKVRWRGTAVITTPVATPNIQHITQLSFDRPDTIWNYARFIDVNNNVFNYTSVVNDIAQFPTLATGTYTFEGEIETSIIEHTQWTLLCKTGGGASGGLYNIVDTEVRVEYLNDWGTPETARGIRLTIPDDATAPDLLTRYSFTWFSGYAILPNWTIGKFLKSIANLFGCNIYVDEGNKQVEFYPIRNLYDRQGEGKDWSEKIVEIDKAQWSTRGQYGQTSIIKFTNEEKVGTDYAQYSISVNDNTLPITKNIIEVPYGATRNGKYFENLPSDGESISIIKRLDNTGKYSGSENQRILYYNWWQGNLGTLTYKKPDGSSFATTTTNQLFTWFNSVNNSILDNIGFDKRGTLFYRHLGYIAKEYKQLTAYFILTAKDINEIDFRYPVYIEQFNDFFFIQKVKDWVSGKPVAVELVKLN